MKLTERFELLNRYSKELLDKFKEPAIELCEKIKDDERLGSGDLMTILATSVGMIVAQHLSTNFEFISISNEVKNENLNKYQFTAEALSLLCMQALSIFCSQNNVDESLDEMRLRFIHELINQRG